VKFVRTRLEMSMAVVLVFALLSSGTARADCEKCWIIKVGRAGYKTPMCVGVDVGENGFDDCMTIWSGINPTPSCQEMGSICQGSSGSIYDPYWWCKIFGCPIGGPGPGTLGGCHFVAADGTCAF